MNVMLPSSQDLTGSLDRCLLVRCAAQAVLASPPHGAAGFGVDALDHRSESIRALRRQVLGQAETPEHALRIGPNDFIRAPARVDRKEDGDEAPHDMGAAVALENEARRGPVDRAIDLGREPDLTGAAANSVRLRSRRFR
jgi:hypothetical protein